MMRTCLLWATLLLSLAAGTSSASVFRIDFTGVITSGTTRTILSDQSSVFVDLTPGASITGFVLFDTSLAPMPVTQISPTNSTTTFSESGGVQWLGGSVTVELPAFPPDVAFPIPSVMPLVPIPPTPGAQINQPSTSDQGVTISRGDGCCDALVLSSSFSDNWFSDTDSIFRSILLGLLISSVDPFLPGTDGVPPSFVLTNPAGGSRFLFVDFQLLPGFQDPPLFGIQRSFSVDAFFDVTGGHWSPASRTGNVDRGRRRTCWSSDSSALALSVTTQ